MVEAGFGLAERVVVVVFSGDGEGCQGRRAAHAGDGERGKSGWCGQDKAAEAPNLATTSPDSMARNEDL